MEILNLVCYGCSAFLSIVVLMVLFIIFVSSLYSCFSKKIKGELYAKIIVVIVSGCLSPWVFKFVLFWMHKIFG